MVVPNVTVCGVAGVMSAGGECAETETDKTSSLNLDQWIDFLEPNLTSSKGAALCMSPTDYKKMKDAIDYACSKLGRWCSHEVASTISQVDARVGRLQTKVMERRKQHDAIQTSERIRAKGSSPN